MYFGALSRYRKGWAISFKKLADQFLLLFDQAKNKKVDEHIDIQRQFQNSTTCPNDMIHTLVTSMFPDFIMRATAMLKTPLGIPMGLSMTLTNLIRKMRIIWRQCVGGTTIFWSNVGKNDGGEGPDPKKILIKRKLRIFFWSRLSENVRTNFAWYVKIGRNVSWFFPVDSKFWS